MSRLLVPGPVALRCAPAVTGVFTETRPALRLDRVSLAYGDVLALDEVSVDFPAGSATAIVGANGAGKSSLIAVAAGMIRPLSGAVTVEGHAVTRGNGSNGLLGVLTHRSMLYDGLTGRENLLLHARLRGLPAWRVDAVLEETRLEGVADRRVGGLSHGTRKRLSLARALLHDPSVLLLDEPFAGLDAEAQEELSRMFVEVRGRKTLVFSTHEAERAQHHADRVVRLEAGRVASEQPRATGLQVRAVAPNGRSASTAGVPGRSAGVVGTAAAVLRKDLTIEARTRSMSSAVLVLAGLLATVLAMAFEPLAGSPRAVSGMLWVLIVFTALHALARSFDEDFRDDALRGLLSSGADPMGMYLGRVASTAALLFGVALVAALVLAVFFAAPSLLAMLPGLTVIMAVAVVGLAAVGSVLTVLSHHSRLGETFLPLLFLPLAVPVLLAGVEAVAILLESGDLDAGWLRVLALYAVGMVAAGIMVFEHAAEE
jgi:heme exporter protein A